MWSRSQVSILRPMTVASGSTRQSLSALSLQLRDLHPLTHTRSQQPSNLGSSPSRREMQCRYHGSCTGRCMRQIK